jgi:hypothetical protein
MENRPPTIEELFPHLNLDDLKEAEENLDLYLNLVLRIFERVESETNSQAAPLTASNGTLPCTRSGQPPSG